MSNDTEQMLKTPKLGFGLMRLPREGDHTDIPQVCKMVDAFLEAGFTYFDTAYVYGTSEEDTKKALVDRHPRESYTLATKLNVGIAPTEEEAKQQFHTSLQRTGAGYFDYYLLHALQANNYRKYEEFHLWEFAKDLKAKGLIRHLGFSYHDQPQLLDQILTEHPETEFVQLQINYADWENPGVAARANYEVARKHGVPVVIMEPVKGGTLANPSEDIVKLLKDHHPDMSCASWAVRFTASLDGVITVLSGMSNTEQMEDNLSYMKDFKPLDEAEQKVIQQAQRILGNSSTISCTACHYCTDGCPMQIAIPELFFAVNKQLGNGQQDEALRDYKKAATPGHCASDCIECGQCEEKCPQHLPIIEHLKKCAAMMEG